MKRILNVIISMFVITILLQSCKHNLQKEGDSYGPQYIPASQNFAVKNGKINVSDLLPNFADRTSPKSNVNITAMFNEKVSWTLTVKGLTSKASYEVKGLSDALNVNWNGVSSNIYFFKKGEKCTIELTFFGNSSIVIKEDLVIQDVFSYKGTWVSNKYSGLLLGNGITYHFVDDLEDQPDINTKFTNIYRDLADVECKSCFNQKDIIDPVQGSYSYLLSGKDDNNNTYVGSMNINKLFGLATRINPNITNDNLYVNLYVYGNGKTNTTLNVFAYEMDALDIDGITYKYPDLLNKFDLSSNDNTVYNQNKNDKWIYSININWTGWRFVTIKYSDFKKPTNDSNKGGGKLEAFKLSGLAFELSSQPSAGQEVYCKIDYVTVTEGGPFKQ